MKVYSTKEVAEKLDIHSRTVLKLINKGELPTKKVAGKWRITENQLRRYLENKRSDITFKLFNIIDQETRDLFGEEEAKKLRNRLNKRLKDKKLDPVDW